nr:MAG TPA: hypothetical protein [Caudoviricetes sp.]DAK64624.1 MAG TPA: hypothetical protein [Caudoviricetes sp.]
MRGLSGSWKLSQVIRLRPCLILLLIAVTTSCIVMWSLSLPRMGSSDPRDSV